MTAIINATANETTATSTNAANETPSNAAIDRQLSEWFAGDAMQAAIKGDGQIDIDDFATVDPATGPTVDGERHPLDLVDAAQVREFLRGFGTRLINGKWFAGCYVKRGHDDRDVQELLFCVGDVIREDVNNHDGRSHWELHVGKNQGGKWEVAICHHDDDYYLEQHFANIDDAEDYAVALTDSIGTLNANDRFVLAKFAAARENRKAR